MDQIYSLPPIEQAERFRALFVYLDRQHMRLVQTYQLAVPPFTVQAVTDRFSKTKRARGFEIVRASLLDGCILAITKLLLDGSDANPSLLTMVRPFLRANREKRADLLQLLEHDYSDWHKTISPEERQTEPDWAIRMFEEQGEKDAQASREEFWQRANAVAADWPKLVTAAKTFKPVRNKWIAHFEVEYDQAARKYKTAKMPSLPEVYRAIGDVVPIITESVSHLAGLFKNLAISTEQTAELAKGDAFSFWELPYNTTPPARQKRG